MKKLINYEGNFCSLNKAPRFKVGSEKFVYIDGKEYRVWDPYRSKVAAAMMNSKGDFFFEGLEDRNVLYLGASSGNTVSHLSDFISGRIFAVEKSYEMGVFLVNLAKVRENIFPIIGDVKDVEYLRKIIGREVKIDIIVQDITGRFQTDLLVKNCLEFANSETLILYSIKLSSISSKEGLRSILKKEKIDLEENFEILEEIDLYPYEKGHFVLVLRLKRDLSREGTKTQGL